MANRASFPILLTLLFAAPIKADTLFKDPFEIHQPVLHTVVITPGAKLMTEMGQSALLSAQVIDEDGAPISSTVFWRSTNEALVSVDSAGLVTTHASIGSAQIIAEAEGALPDFALVTIADPVDGAVLIDDAQVVVAPEPVDLDAEYGLGYEYAVTLSGMGPLGAGDVLVGTGEQAIGGEVVSVSKGAGDTTVVLRVVPLDAMFDELVIHERIDLSDLPIDIVPEVAELFDSTRLTDGSWVLSPRDTITRAEKAADLGSLLKCKSSTTNLYQFISVKQKDQFVLDPSFSLDLDYDSLGGGLQQLLISGGLHAEYKLELRAKPQFQGSITCKLKLGAIPIPLSGPLSWLFSGQVPLGVGAKIGGKVSISQPAGFDLNVNGNANFMVGLGCQPDCELLADLDSGVDASAELVTPIFDTILSVFQLDLLDSAFFYADLTFGNPLFTQLQFETFSVEAGVKHSGLFRSVQAQVNDLDFASEFKMELFGKAGPGNDILKTLTKFGISVINLDVFANITTILAESPKGHLIITDPNGGSSATPENPALVVPGDGSQLGEMATFTVVLDPTTYLGVYNVEEVLIYWRKPDGQGGITLELSRPGCNTFTAINGQKQFTCQADFLEEHVGEREFYAFVKASLFGVPIPFHLEVNKDSTARLLVQETDPKITYSAYVKSQLVDRSPPSEETYYVETDTFSRNPQPDSIDAIIMIPGLGSASADASTTSASLDVLAEAHIDSGQEHDYATARSQASLQGNQLNLTELTVSLSGAINLFPTQEDEANVEIWVSGEIYASPLCNGEDDVDPAYCHFAGRAEFCAPSLDGNETCEGDEQSFGVLEGWTGGALTLTLGPLVGDPFELTRIKIKVEVEATENSSVEATVEFLDLTQFE